MANTLRDHLDNIIQKHVTSIVADALAAYRSHLAAGLTTAAPLQRSAVPQLATPKRKKRPGVGAKVSAALKNRPCPVPGCKKPTKGPRYRFFCEEHRVLPKKEQVRIIAEGKAGAKGVAAKSATATKVKPKKGKAPKKKSVKGKAEAKKVVAAGVEVAGVEAAVVAPVEVQGTNVAEAPVAEAKTDAGQIEQNP